MLNGLIEYGLALAAFLALAVGAAIIAKGLGEALRGAGEGAKAVGQGAKAAGEGAGSLLGGILGGVGAGAGRAVAGLGEGIGNVAHGLGRAAGGARPSGGGQQMRKLDGPFAPAVHQQRHSSAGPQRPGNGWSSVVTGLGIGLGLGAAGLQGARSAARWAQGQASVAADAWRERQARQAWQQWHAQGAPAYAWNVGDDPYMQGVMAGKFAEAGVRFDWQQDSITGAWQVVINAEDLGAAEAAMGAAGLEFQDYGQPIGYDGAPWQPGSNDAPPWEQPGEQSAPMGDVIDGHWWPVGQQPGPADTADGLDLGSADSNEFNIATFDGGTS